MDQEHRPEPEHEEVSLADLSFQQVVTQPYTPEKELQLAVLQDAIMTYRRHAQRPHRISKLITEETREWIAENDDNYIYAYSFICKSLGIDPSYLRKRLLTLEPRAISLRGTRQQRGKYKGVAL